MPVENKSLPRIPESGKDYPSDESAFVEYMRIGYLNLLCFGRIDLLDQVRRATYSPSPLVRILQDPTILPMKPAESKKEQRTHRASRQREHRSPMVAAIAIAEEERHAKQLKALLRSSGDRLEYETRRAEDAIARADYAERQEKEALARARAAELAKEQMQIESTRLERDMRNYQLQLEEAHIETRRIEGDLEHACREIEELRDAESQAQDLLQRYQKQLDELGLMMMERTAAAQRMVDKSYEDGWQDGYGAQDA